MWFSSTWSRAALKAFRLALTAVLQTAETGDSPSASAARSAGVQAFLRNWQLRDVALAEARAKWTQSHRYDSSFTCAIANFKREEDRVALCRCACAAAGLS